MKIWFPLFPKLVKIRCSWLVVPLTELGVWVWRENTRNGISFRQTVCNTSFKKGDSQLMTYTSGPSNTRIDYIMARNKTMTKTELDMLKLFLEKRLYNSTSYMCMISYGLCSKRSCETFCAKKKGLKIKGGCN